GWAEAVIEEVGEAQVGKMEIIDDVASFFLPIAVFVIAGEMAIGMQPTIAVGNLKTAARRQRLTGMEAVLQHSARHAGSMRGHTALREERRWHHDCGTGYRHHQGRGAKRTTTKV